MISAHAVELTFECNRRYLRYLDAARTAGQHVSGDTGSNSRYLRSQVLSLRVFSAFWLTAGSPEPLEMANSRGKQLSQNMCTTGRRDVMAECAYCGTETQLFENGKTICIKCDSTRSLRK